MHIRKTLIGTVGGFIVLVALVLGLAACGSQGEAVGDTQHTEPAVQHDGADRNGIYACVVGSAHRQRESLNSAVVTAIDRSELHAVFMSTSNDESQHRAVEDCLDRNLRIVVLIADQPKGWEQTLQQTRRIGIPVVLVDSSITPDDHSLYAAHLKTVSDERIAQESRHTSIYNIGDALMDVVDDAPHPRTMKVRLGTTVE